VINSTSDFIRYFEGIRRRTLNYLQVLPPDRLDWSPKPGEFTCGDILRHLAAAESMFVGVVIEGRWKYSGHEASGSQDLDELLRLLETGHLQAMERLGQLADDQLYELRPSIKGHPLKAWRWLMAMVEHEIHHRSQLAVYLSLMGVQPPHIYGLGVEDIIALATG
jgi:uncharacterized damage-inducible protein DinB